VIAENVGLDERRLRKRPLTPIVYFIQSSIMRALPDAILHEADADRNPASDFDEAEDWEGSQTSWKFYGPIPGGSAAR
jgi:hypothetical protein